MDSSSFQARGCRGSQRTSSAQHAKLIAVVLAVRHSVQEKQPMVRIFTDSWTVANGITIWSQRWKKTDFKINGREVWSRDYRKELSLLAEQIKILVTHVSTHRKGETPDEYYNIADSLTKESELRVESKDSLSTPKRHT